MRTLLFASLLCLSAPRAHSERITTECHVCHFDGETIVGHPIGVVLQDK